MDHPGLVLRLPAHGAAFPAREALEGLQTRPVEHVGAGQQNLQVTRIKRVEQMPHTVSALAGNTSASRVYR